MISVFFITYFLEVLGKHEDASFFLFSLYF